MANNRFQVKRTTTAGRTPNTTNVANTQYIYPGEFGLNMTDQILYTSDGTNLITVGANQVNQKVTGTLTVNAISANGSVGGTNQILTSNGSTVYWSSPGAASVNTDAQYTWSNTQTFSNTITFGNSTVNTTVNTTSFNVLNNTAVVNTTSITFNSNVTVDQSATAKITVGNSTVNTTINSTSTNVGANIQINTSAIFVGNSTINTIITSSQMVTNSVFFYPTNTALVTVSNTSESAVYYDSTTHAMLIYSDDPSTPLYVGQQELARVVNKTAAPLTYGTPVYLDGVQGNRPTVAPAQANSTAFDVVGLIATKAGIPVNGEGFVITNGILTNVSTVAYNSGDILWLANTAGNLTATQPSYPDWQTQVGHALNSTNNGKIYVNIQSNFLTPAPNTSILLWDGKNQTSSNNFTFDYANNVLYVGNSTINTIIGYTNTAGTVTFKQINGIVNASLDSVIVNYANTGATNSSADFALYDSNGPSSNNFVDIGINGTAWNQSYWTINGPSDGYVYTGNTNLSIGTQGVNYLNFFTGGTLAANERMRITPTGNVGIGNNAPTNLLSVGGSTYLGGNLTIIGNTTVVNVYSTGTINSVSYTIGTTFVANTITLNSNGFVVNSTGAYVTGLANATSFNTGTSYGATGAIVNVTTIGVSSNTTVNTNITSSQIQVANSTGTSNLTATSLTIGTSVVNTTVVSVGANVYANVTTLFVGNTTVNASHNSSLVQVSNSTSTANLTAADLKIGSTTVVNSSQVTATLLNGNVSGSYANITGQVNAATFYATTSANIASAVQANATGIYTTGTVNAASYTTGSALGSAGATVNVTTIGVSTNSTVNSTVTSSQIQVANSTGTSNLTATSLTIGTSIVNTTVVAAGANVYANVTTLFVGNTTVNASHNSSLVQVSNSTSTANLTAADLKIGATTVVNSSQVTATLHVGNVSGSYANITGQVNTATLYATTSANIASAVQANATGVYTTGTVNGASITVGTSFVANSSNVTSSVPTVFNNTVAIGLNNNKLSFTPLAGGANVYFIQQNDDNFVFYSSNTLNQPRSVFSIFGNSVTSSFNFSTNVVVSGSLTTSNLVSNGTAYVSNGFYVTPGNWGVVSANITLNSSNGNYQYLTSNAAYTITAPAQDCAIDILLTNGSGAGTITFSGFTVGSSTGSAYATTNGNRYILSVRRINSISTYSWYALQ